MGWVTIDSDDLNSKIFDRIQSIEQTLARGLKQIEERLDAGQDTFLLFREGLHAYKVKTLKESALSNSPMQKLYEQIRTDRDLQFQHRKILEFLLGLYDFSKNQFTEINFSKLAKGARVAKNRANGYLSLLEQKGYVLKRDTGYRIFFRIRQ